MLKKIVIVAVLLGIIASYFLLDLGEYLNLEALKSNKDTLFALYQDNKFIFFAGFFLIYVVSTAVSIPGAAILTLAAGFIFGRWYGTILVSFASCIGATVAMVIARSLLGSSLQAKYQKQLTAINAGIAKDGPLYLLSLRLIPVFPFFLINLLMGLTTMPVSRFYLYSQIGMLPGTFVFVNAGTALSSVEELEDILSIEIFASFALLGLLPLIIKFAMNKISKIKKKTDN